MRIIASIATYPSREDSLLQTLRSIRDQVDHIFVHVNDLSAYKLTDEHRKSIDTLTTFDDDLTDNGKFFALQYLTEDCYFLSMDDDLVYADDYVDNMVKQIDKFECIVTHHGRKLIGLGRDYYNGHIAFRCLAANEYALQLDVAGTGVTGFRTSYFFPDIWQCPDLKMSDIIFSLEARKQNKRIMLLPHPVDHIKQVGIDDGIWGEFVQKKPTRQNELADEIFKLRDDFHIDVLPSNFKYVYAPVFKKGKWVVALLDHNRELVIEYAYDTENESNIKHSQIIKLIG